MNIRIVSFLEETNSTCTEEDSDLTQREMGEILHCSQRVYSNYERGDLDIPTDILIKLAKFYHVSTDYLLGLTNQKEPYISNEPFKERNR